MSWHQTIIVGNLGGDPEMKYLQNGSAVTNFSVAVTERWKDRQTNENREKTTWYRVDAWGGLAETCNTHLQKGSQVMVIGTVSANGFKNNNGEASASLNLKAMAVRFLSKSANNGDGQSSGGNGGGNQHMPSTADDIPF